jgi:single-stranded-DNA-specific exonuclease
MGDAQALAFSLVPRASSLASDSTRLAGTDFALGIDSSFSRRTWRMRMAGGEMLRALELAGYSASVAQLLATRGITPDRAGQYLDPKIRDLLPDPYALAQMELAANRFADAIMRRERIAVLADYDVDGACSAALIQQYLDQFGIEAMLHVPDRLTEGYGPSAGAIRGLHARGASLLVTLDCGATAVAPFAAARECGLDVIVLDHHPVETNPPVFAHVNPNGPDDRGELRSICAAGLSFVFLVAVQRVLRDQRWFSSAGFSEPDLMAQLDLVALATVADVVPLIGLNRAFVRQGLRRLESLQRPGFAALARVANSNPPYSAYNLGFVFGPRINAGGRVGRCDLGARLLSTKDSGIADNLAAELDRHNRERQAIEAGILATATEMAGSQRDWPFVLVGGNGWHPGVVGIIAGRLKDRHAKPALVAGFPDDGAEAVGRGSARSAGNVDLGAVIRAAHSEGILDAGGGHAMAAGFSIRRSRLAEFEAFLGSRIDMAPATIPELQLDSMISTAGANLALLDDIQQVGPFGSGNSEPLFLLPDVLLVYAAVAGGEHVRIRAVGRDGQGIGAIAFRAAKSELGAALLGARGRRVHLAGKLRRDDFDGVPKAQLHLEDAAGADA